MTKSSKLLFILLLCSPLLLSAQIGRVNESSVKTQEQFIDASREKLLGNYENAIDILKSILNDDPKNAAAAFELARSYEAMGDAQKAIRHAEEASEWDPDNIWYFKFLASLYQGKGEDKKAAKAYERILELEPQVEDHYYRRAFFLVRANEIKDALKVYEKLEDRIGVSEEVIRRKHALYLGIGDDKKAAGELRRLIEAYPSDMGYRHLLAEFYVQIEEEQEANAVYQEILKLDPDNAKAQLALAGQSVQDSDEVKYLKSLQSAFLQEEAGIDIKLPKLIPFIQKVAEEGDPRLADAGLELTNILERIHPAEAKAYSAAGDLLYHSGRKKQAIDKYLKTIELDDSKFFVWEQAMKAYRETYQYEELRDFSERAMDYYPNQPIVYYMYAYALQELGDEDEALGLLDQAYFMAGGNAYIEILVLSLRGRIYNKTQEYERSDKAFEQALQMDAAAPPALQEYAYALAQRGERLKDAQNMALKANELFPGQADYQATLAEAYYAMENYEKAKSWLEKALKSGGALSPEIVERHGDVLYQQGQVEQAMLQWKKAQQLGGNSDALERKISEGKIN
jgi:tetratricopeptide (TPR) repeat protein